MKARLAVPDDAALAALDERWHGGLSPATRSEAQRDCDRILYSSAFQRLARVTQVTASETGLTFHSRLTHSLKVAQFARRLAERLCRGAYIGAAARAVHGLDPDAAEAAALAHDLGHPPFGHLAEEELNDAAKSFGGFEGNAQSFRILTRLALRSSEHLGLDLTRRTLNGMLKYPWGRDPEDAKRSSKWNYYASEQSVFAWVRSSHAGTERSLEAEIMDWADDVTYAVHDMDDFYRAGLVPLDELCRDARERDDFKRYIAARGADRAHKAREVGDEAAATAAEERAARQQDVADMLFPGLIFIGTRYAGRADERIALRALGSGLITRYIEAPTLTVDAGNDAYFVIDDAQRNEVDVLKLLVWFYVIDRPSLAIMQAGQRKVMRTLYRSYEQAALTKRERFFPVLYRERLRTASTDDAKRRIVIDLVSSLTESSAVEIFRRLTGTAGGSVGDATGRVL